MRPAHDSISSGRSHSRRFGYTAYFLGVAALSVLIFPGLIYGQGYVQTNLVSDGSVKADFTDPSLINPWGLVQGPTTPFWVSDQGTNVSTLYTGNGTMLGLIVSIPTVKTPPNGPTGIVFNGGGSGFVVTSTAGTSASLFLFADLNGGIYGWNGGALNKTADVGATVTGGVLTGLAINAAKSDIWVSNFTSTGSVIEFNSAWTQTMTLTAQGLPAGYEPYNVQDINGTLFVAYEPMQSNGRPLQGIGNGVIAEFNDSTGAFIKNLIVGDQLDDPWGMAVAPSDFGQFSNDLLVGNFGNGVINAYDPTTGAFLGTIEFPDGTDISNDGLWALMFGTGGAGSDPGTLYITAGLNGEQDGLLAAITPSGVPEPASLLLLGSGLLGIAWAFHRRRAKAV